MNTPNKIIFIITVLLAAIILAASCSKESATNKKGKGGKKPVAIKTSDISPVGKGSLSAIRKGQYATLNWQIDSGDVKIEKINIVRSATGKGANQKGVATLKPDATSYDDCLPNENAYTYWIKAVTADGKSLEIGPARVDIDKAGSANYIKMEDRYTISIIRTDDLATLKWDFPENEYAGITIIRSPRPVAKPFNQTGKNGKVTTVIKTLEGKSQHTDALPDANADYWYWFRITLKSGTIIDRGPIKAGYAGQ